MIYEQQLYHRDKVVEDSVRNHGKNHGSLILCHWAEAWIILVCAQLFPILLCLGKFLVANCPHRECHSRKLLSREQQPLFFHGNLTSPPIIYTKEHRCQQLYRSSIVCFRSSNHSATASSMYTFTANSLVFIRAWFNGVLSGLRQFLAAESPLKIMKNAIYCTSKAVVVLKIFKFLSRLFGHVAKRLDRKDRVNFNFFDVTAWLTNNCNAHIA